MIQSVLRGGAACCCRCVTGRRDAARGRFIVAVKPDAAPFGGACSLFAGQLPFGGSQRK